MVHITCYTGHRQGPGVPGGEPWGAQSTWSSLGQVRPQSFILSFSCLFTDCQSALGYLLKQDFPKSLSSLYLVTVLSDLFSVDLYCAES